MTPRHTILHSMVTAVQHPFQLYQQKNHFYSFCTCDKLVRTIDDNKKKTLPLLYNVNALLFSI